jgi:non-heme chloroperoxidase
MATVDVGGVSLFWTEKGTGSPVVLVHGIPTDYRAWDTAATALSDGYRAIAYSRRYASPNARAGDVSDSTIPANAADLAGLITKLGIAPVHLVGHSYGGFASAFLATQRPELLRSLTLIEPAIASLLLKDPRSAGQKLGLLLRSPGVALSAQRFLRDSNGPALDALRRNDPAAAVRLNLDGIEDREGAFDRFDPPTQAMFLDNARTIAETDTPYPPLGRAELASIRRPCLVVHGETSALWLRSIAQAAGAAIPGAEVTAIPGSGHFPHLQNPAAFHATLRRFLDRVSPSA